MLKIAVITPYANEPVEILQQAHQSVIRQSWPCTHVLVADGSPRPEVSRWKADHLILPSAHNDIGSTPRLVGCYHAIGLGFEAVAFLDADNWYREDHIQTLVALRDLTKASFLSSGRLLCRLDGSVIHPCPSTDPERFVDTSCMMFTAGCFHLLANWVLMPSYAHLIGDRVMLHHVRRSGVQRAHSGLPTVFYRCGKDDTYLELGEPVPEGAKARPDYEGANARWVAEGHATLL